MDNERKKQLLSEYKLRCPEMGLIALTCKATGEVFAGVSTDTQVAFNSHRFKLSAGMHPNKQLQQLWQQYGEDGFGYSVVATLEYEGAEDDRAEELALLLEEYLADNPQVRRLSK